MDEKWQVEIKDGKKIYHLKKQKKEESGDKKQIYIKNDKL